MAGPPRDPGDNRSTAGKLRAWIFFALLVVPFAVGLLLMDQLPVGLRPLPGGVLMVALALAAFYAIKRLIRPIPDGPSVPGFFGRHPRIAVPAFLVLGLAGLGFGIPCLADPFVPQDTVDVVVTGIIHSARGGYETIRTTERAYDTAFFVVPDVQPGPATLTVGHISGRVLQVQQ